MATTAPPCPPKPAERRRLHYHVWFDFKPEIEEARGLAVIRDFMASLTAHDAGCTSQLLQNRGTAPRSRLGRFHALFIFPDSATFEVAMKAQAQRGIHNGSHGAVVEVVSDFHVEIFDELAPATVPESTHACEI